MFRLFSWVAGIFTLPMLGTDMFEALDNTSSEPIPWWWLPLIALGILIATWLLGQVLPLIVESYAAGYRIGAFWFLILAWFIPENRLLYGVASIVVLPIAWITAAGQLSRVRQAREWGWITQS